MSALTINRPSSPNQSILLSIILSIGVTLLLWFLQATFNLSSFWVFLIYIVILLLIFYVIVPRFFQRGAAL